MYILLFTYYSLSSADYTENPVVPDATAIRPVPLRPRVSRGRVHPGAPKDANAAPSHIRIHGNGELCSHYFLDLMDDDGESDGSSIGDMVPSHRPSRECAMADASGHPPVEAESS